MSFLERLQEEGGVDRIITTDETWLHHYDPKTKQQFMMWTLKENIIPQN